MPINAHRISLVACCLAGIVGCGQEVFRAETKLEANGRVTRAIFQPKAETPESIRKPGVWSGGMTYSVERPAEPWSTPISSLPIVPETERPYFAAWGTFESVEKLPQHYIMKAPAGLPDGTLAREYKLIDYGFVIEHRWRETLTEIVSLDDMHQARDELIRLLIDTGYDILHEALGDEYDFRDLARWFDTAGRSWFSEIADALYDVAVRNRDLKDIGPEFQSASIRICLRHGFAMRAASGEVFEGEELQRQVETFARGIVRRHLKRRDEKPMSDEEVEQITATILGGVSWSPPGEAKTSLQKKLDSAAERVVTRRFGSREAFEQKIQPLATRVLGLYQVGVLRPPRRFHYTLEVPGAITQSNGVLVSDRVVEWSFNAAQAFPSGYTMECRFLVPNVEQQQHLLNGTPLTTHESLARYVNLMERDKQLHQVVNECVSQRTMKPLLSHPTKVAADALRPKGKSARNDRSGESVSRVVQLVELLKLDDR